MKIKELPLLLVARLRATLPQHFSIDEFVSNNKTRIGTVCNGMDDEHFPLLEDCSGEMDLLIFIATKDIGTRSALRIIKDEDFIFTGVKGIASLITDCNGKVPIESWILSPNRLIQDSDVWQRSGIPYLSTQHLDIKYSNHSINLIPEGKYLLLGKKIA